MWDGAAARAADIGAGHEVTIGDTDADFAAGIAEAEALITEIGVVAAKFPCPAPRLKLLFITNAGLDALAPFDWLPPGVALLNNARHPCGEGRRVRHHVGADAGQPRAARW